MTKRKTNLKGAAVALHMILEILDKSQVPEEYQKHLPAAKGFLQSMLNNVVSEVEKK